MLDLITCKNIQHSSIENVFCRIDMLENNEKCYLVPLYKIKISGHFGFEIPESGFYLENCKLDDLARILV